MMDSRKFILRKTAVIALGQTVCVAVMIGVFALLGHFERSVLLGGILGGVIAIGNFFAMAVCADLAADKAEKALTHMCVYTHGYASMLAGGQMKSTPEHIAEYICAAHKYLLVALRRDEE